MSFYNATKNPFPFYKLEGEVWTNKKPLWFSNNCNYQFQKYPIFPGKIYFQLRVSDNISNQTDTMNINLRKVSDNTTVAAVINKTLYAHQKLNKKFVIIAIDIPSNYVNDQFYISVETDYGFYYSETFCVKTPNNYIGIVWSSSTGRVGDLIYPLGYRNSINIDAEVIPLEPQIEVETVENGFGEEEATLQILKQGYRLSFMAPNFLAQAFSALPMHDQIQIVNRKKYDYDQDFDDEIKDVQAKITPEEDGCFSLVEISFVEETIIVTACVDEIIPANNPPQADIVWGDTQTTENRVCNSNGACSTSLLATEFTYDVDNNLDYLEWEKSENAGDTWVKIGDGTVGIPFNVSEDVEKNYWYRLKAVDTYNAVGYSNILQFNVDNSPSFANVVYSAQSNDFLYSIKLFDIVGEPSQTVKLNLNVITTYGRGFTLKVFDRLTSAELFTLNSGPAGTQVNKFLTLDGAGVGKYSANLLLQPCNGEAYQNTDIGFTLFKNDNITLGNSKMNIEKYINCILNIPITLPPGWLP